jgi:hypothetical protein
MESTPEINAERVLIKLPPKKIVPIIEPKPIIEPVVVETLPLKQENPHPVAEKVEEKVPEKKEKVSWAWLLGFVAITFISLSPSSTTPWNNQQFKEEHGGADNNAWHNTCERSKRLWKDAPDQVPVL